ncbi:MAG: HD domain-containing protein [Bacteroidetes bacterium]|nr:HD domain-containing protein [Bacteroidota bacterium]
MSNIIDKAKKYVTEYLSNYLSTDYNYHCINHTLDVVKNTEEISRALLLSEKEFDIAILAAWFHDVGYSKGINGHEKVSIDIAENFLIANNFLIEDIEQVKKCIEATKLSHVPNSLLEGILSDADILHIGNDDCLEKSELLRKELKQNQNKNYSDDEWIKNNIEFLTKHNFYTKYAKTNYGLQRIKNIEKLKNQFK